MFVDFVTQVLGVALTPGQRVLCLVSFDGVDPCKLRGTERDLARQMFGDCDTIPPAARHTVCWLKGARIGGSYLCALYLLYLGYTCPVESEDSKLAEGENAFCTCVAPDKKTARQPYNYIVGAVRANPELSRLVVGVIGIESFVIQRHDGVSVCFEVAAASVGGSALRGRSYIAALLDECCFFRDPDSGLVNDLELNRAIAPRIVTGGCLMVISTAWAKRGLLWDLVEKNRGNEDATCVAAIAPTLLVRPTAQNKRTYAEEMERDPDNARREFDCEALAIGTGDFIEPEAIRQCIDDALPLVVLPNEGVRVAAGLDTGFKRDPSALVFVHGKAKEPLLVAECVERRPELAGADPAKVLAEFKIRLDAHHCKRVGCDQHYIQTVRGELHGCSVVECSPSSEFKLESYTHVRDLLRSRGIIIPAANRRLLAQLRDIQCTPLSGGGMRIFSPRQGGAHGDIASALVLAVWLVKGAVIDWSQWAERSSAIADFLGASRSKRNWGIGT